MLLVTYDLSQPDRDYQTLDEALMTANGYAKVTESSWLLAGEDDPKAWRDKLTAVMHRNDRLFVCGVAHKVAWQKVLCGNDWLKDKNNWL